MTDRYRLLASTTDVDEVTVQLSTQILSDYPTSSPLFVSLLRGAAPFSSKLMFELVLQSPDYHPELDYMMVSTYGHERTAGEPKIVTDLAPTTSVQDRDIIIIDDVLDKGITANFVIQLLQSRGAGSVKLAVLCDKRAERAYDVTADYVGFTFSDNWLVGMGMDDAEEAAEGYRWLQEIWEIAR